MSGTGNKDDLQVINNDQGKHKKNDDPGTAAILLFIVCMFLIFIWIVMKILLVITGNILIGLMKKKKKIKAGLFKTHLVATIVSIFGTLAGLLIFVFISIFYWPPANQKQQITFLYLVIIAFALMTIIEITYSILLSKYKKYCVDTNEKILISQVIISILMFLFGIYFFKKFSELLGE